MKDYSDLKGKEIPDYTHALKSKSGEYTDCFLGQIDFNKGLTIMGVWKGNQIKVFCIRDYDPKFRSQMNHAVKMIEKGEFNAEKHFKKFHLKLAPSGEPICAFE